MHPFLGQPEEAPGLGLELLVLDEVHEGVDAAVAVHQHDGEHVEGAGQVDARAAQVEQQEVDGVPRPAEDEAAAEHGQRLEDVTPGARHLSVHGRRGADLTFSMTFTVLGSVMSAAGQNYDTMMQLL